MYRIVGSHARNLVQYLALLFAFSLSIVASTSFAQQDEIEEIVVTGSYIKGTPEDAPLPVTILNRDDLLDEGSPTTLDLIKNLSFSQGADGETDQFQAGAGADRATINIRGLGPSRSLVLINGRRTTWSPFAIGAQAQLLVDVNMMPSIALERIEILRDGAAATYGSDAIAGVMNFITRGDFTGFEISANHKAIQDSDGDNEIGVIWGGAFADDRMHLVSSFSYIERGELELVERDWAVRPYAESPLGGWSSVGRPSVFVPYDRFDATAGGFGGLLGAGIVDPNCELLGGAITSTPEANPEGGFCRFQYTAFDNLAEEANRWQWFTEFTWDISDTTVLSAEFLMTDSDVPGWNTSPSYPPNRLVDRDRALRANNPGLIDMASRYPNLYGDYASCAEAYCRYTGDGGVQDADGVPTEWQDVAWYYGRYYGQDGPLRDHKRESELWRLNVALEGEVGEYGWQTSVGYSESERISLGGDTMVYRDARARQGLAGFGCEAQVPNEYNANGELEFSLATVMANAGQGPCSYWTPFSNSMAGSHPQVLNGTAVNPDFNPALDNQDIYDYMITGLGGEGETSLLVVEGIFTGSLWDLPGGEINFAVGAQWRSETYESGVLSGGLNDGIAFPCQAGPEITNCTSGRTGLFGFLPPGFPIDEERDIYSVFGELSLPITDSFESQVSVRYEDYGGDTGSSLDPKVALRWQITDGFGMRASLGTTFRGPTLNQIVSENSSNSLQFVGQTGAFKRIDTKGNPSLDPETATTFNVGLLVDQDFGDSGNLFVTLDYWSYDFEDPLVTEPFNDVLAAACPDATSPCDPTSPFFDRLTFGGNAVATDVEIIDINIVNGPDIETDGFDFTARYGHDLGPGRVTVGFTGTKIQSYDIGAWELGSSFDALGRLNYTTSLARSLVEWKVRGSLNYEWGEVNVRYSANYIDDYVHSGSFGTDVEIDSQTTHDLTVNWRLLEGKASIWASVLNITDEEPPFMQREMNYDAFTHNPFGRIVKVGVSYYLGDQ